MDEIFYLALVFSHLSGRVAQLLREGDTGRVLSLSSGTGIMFFSFSAVSEDTNQPHPRGSDDESHQQRGISLTLLLFLAL